MPIVIALSAAAVSGAEGVATSPASQESPGTNAAQAASPWVFSGDARVRYEKDWAGRTVSGASRADRERERVRLRAMLTYTFDAEWLAGLRLRSGNRHSQQSPHLTLHNSDGAPSDHPSGYFDRYFVQFKAEGVAAWVGRNTSPFWQHAESFWDEDVTPTGATVSFDKKGGAGILTTTFGAFALPDGGTKTHGQQIGAQMKFVAGKAPSQWVFAAGLHDLEGRKRPEFLRNRNGERDYLIGVASVEWNGLLNKIPVTVGADLLRNFKDYTTADAAPLPAINAGERDGFVISAQLGQLKKSGDWMFYYGYARLETFATNASYSPDDYVRFGAGPQTDATDIRGHDVRVAYALTKQLNVMVRVLSFEAITTRQEGKRMRFDVNYKW